MPEQTFPSTRSFIKEIELIVLATGLDLRLLVAMVTSAQHRLPIPVEITCVYNTTAVFDYGLLGVLFILCLREGPCMARCFSPCPLSATLCLHLLVKAVSLVMGVMEESTVFAVLSKPQPSWFSCPSPTFIYGNCSWCCPYPKSRVLLSFPALSSSNVLSAEVLGGLPQHMQAFIPEWRYRKGSGQSFSPDFTGAAPFP